METNQNPKVDEIRQSLEEALRDKRVSYTKIIGWSTVPVLALGGIVLLGNLGASCFENHDVKTAVSMGIGLTLGGIAGYTGMITDYIENFRDFVDDVRYASSRVRDCKSELKSLEQSTQ